MHAETKITFSYVLNRDIPSRAETNTIKHFTSLYNTCVDPESLIRGGVTLAMILLVDEGREDPNITISGPSLAVRLRDDEAQH